MRLRSTACTHTSAPWGALGDAAWSAAGLWAACRAGPLWWVCEDVAESLPGVNETRSADLREQRQDKYHCTC